MIQESPVDRTDIPRIRQFYLAPDIDFTKIKTNKKWLRTIFFCLNAFKCPAPTLMIDSKGKFKAYALYFLIDHLHRSLRKESIDPQSGLCTIHRQPAYRRAGTNCITLTR